MTERLARRLPFFYGWIVVAGAAASASFVLGSAQFALSVFLLPMSEELGWSRSLVFGALSLRFLLAGFLGPMVGPWLDRESAPRIVLPVGAILLAVSLSAIRWVESPFWFFIWYGIVGAVGSALIHLTMWEAVVLKWFAQRRTRALVVGGFGEASGPMIFPLLVTVLVGSFGWRDAWLWYGIIALALLLPLALLVRTRPEHVGQVADSKHPHPTPHRETSPSAREVRKAEGVPQDVARLTGIPRDVAVRTQAFWFLGGAFMLSGFIITGFQAHWVPSFREQGFSPEVAAGAVAVYGLFNIFSRLLWGGLTARFTLRGLMVSHAFAAGLGIVALLTLVRSEPTLFLWAAYQGLVFGSFFSLHTFISADFFGRAHIGAIRGLWMFPTALSRAGGPLLIGALRDLRGAYGLAFWGVVVGWGIMAALIGSSRRPRQED